MGIEDRPNWFYKGTGGGWENIKNNDFIGSSDYNNDPDKVEGFKPPNMMAKDLYNSAFGSLKQEIAKLDAESYQKRKALSRKEGIKTKEGKKEQLKKSKDNTLYKEEELER
jgi:hypothetical protein